MRRLLTFVSVCATVGIGVGGGGGRGIAGSPSAHAAPSVAGDARADANDPSRTRPVQLTLPMDPSPTALRETRPGAEMAPAGKSDPAPPTGPVPAQSDPSPSPEPMTSPAPAPTPAEIPALSAREAWEQGPRHRIAVMPRYAYRWSGSGRMVTPTSGFGIAGTVEVAYLRLFPRLARLEGALGIDFSYDRFASSEVGSAMVDNATTEMFRNPRVTSETSFVLVHTAAANLGRVRPYLTVGLGLGVGYFDSAAAELRPGTARAMHALGRLSAGMDVILTRDWGLSLRADYTAVRGASSMVTDGGETLSLFGDLLGVGAGIAYRF